MEQKTEWPASDFHLFDQSNGLDTERELGPTEQIRANRAIDRNIGLERTAGTAMVGLNSISTR